MLQSAIIPIKAGPIIIPAITPNNNLLVLGNRHVIKLQNTIGLAKTTAGTTRVKPLSGIRLPEQASLIKIIPAETTRYGTGTIMQQSKNHRKERLFSFFGSVISGLATTGGHEPESSGALWSACFISGDSSSVIELHFQHEFAFWPDFCRHGEHLPVTVSLSISVFKTHLLKDGAYSCLKAAYS
jgi:hypothetical protein